MKLFIHLYPVICLPAPLRTTTGPGPAYGSTARAYGPTGLRAGPLAYGPAYRPTGPGPWLTIRALQAHGLTGLTGPRAGPTGLRARTWGFPGVNGRVYIYISRYHWWGDMDFMEFHQQCTDRNDASTWS